MTDGGSQGKRNDVADPTKRIARVVPPRLNQALKGNHKNDAREKRNAPPDGREQTTSKEMPMKEDCHQNHEEPEGFHHRSNAW